MKRPKPLSLLEELSRVHCDSATRAAAQSFLRADWTRFTDQDSFFKAFHGLQCCQQILGPISQEHRKTLAEMRKTLESLHTAFLRWQETDFLDDVAQQWKEVLAVFQSRLTPEEWQRCHKPLENLFKRKR